LECCFLRGVYKCRSRIHQLKGAQLDALTRFRNEAKRAWLSAFANAYAAAESLAGAAHAIQSIEGPQVRYTARQCGSVA
jgi:hypothetical protein